MHQSSREQSIQLQERDFSVFRHLFESRVMTAEHISALCFNDHREMASKRLRRLASAGFIGTRPRRCFDQAVYEIARPGLIALRDRGALSDYPHFDLPVLAQRAHVSQLTLQHDLDMIDCRVAFERAAARNGGHILEFSTWPLLNQFTVSRGRHQLVKPDGFVRIETTSPDGTDLRHDFFVESDRSTESQIVVANKASSYLEFYRSGDYACRRGGASHEFRKFPFRVLFLFETERRRDHAAQSLLRQRPPVLSLAWLTTRDEALADPFGAIWVTPNDYRTDIHRPVANDSSERGFMESVPPRHRHWLFPKA